MGYGRHANLSSNSNVYIPSVFNAPPDQNRCPSDIVAQYRTYHAEWEQLVEVAREARLQAIRNEIADLYAELAKSENQGELDYLGDCRTDIRQMEGVLVKVAALD